MTGRGPQGVDSGLPGCMGEPRRSLPQNIWKSLPLTRLSDTCRTGVGHRRWVRKDTPALRPQPEQRLPSSTASAVPAFPNSPPDSATRFAFPPTPRRTAQPSAENRGARGELFPPHAFPAFLPFCVSRCGRSAGRRRRVCLCAAFVTKNTLFLHGQSGACVLELRACA